MDPRAPSAPKTSDNGPAIIGTLLALVIVFGVVWLMGIPLWTDE